jgi:hypothetical protein
MRAKKAPSPHSGQSQPCGFGKIQPKPRVSTNLSVGPAYTHIRGLRRDPHGSVKQIHHKELKNGDKERPSAFPKIMLKQTDSGIQ